MDTKQLLHFMRETIRLRRAPGESMPWTSDPILGEWSFTKVKREDDRVPRWIAVSWREPQSRSVFRHDRRPLGQLAGHLREIGYPVSVGLWRRVPTAAPSSPAAPI